MGLQCVRHDATPRADDTVEWGRGQCERDEGVWRCESGAGLVRQRDLHMLGTVAARKARRAYDVASMRMCAVCIVLWMAPGACAHITCTSNVAWYGSSEPLVLRNHPARARAPHCDDSDGVCGTRGARCGCRDPVGCSTFWRVCHARAWGSDVAWTSAGRVGARHVPMWRRGRPRRSASTTHRCAGSLARVYERTCAAHSQPSMNRETFESRIFFALHQ
jgi:hypothetical protein